MTAPAMQESEVLIPAPLDHQLPIVASRARFKVVRAGRRGGKTVLAEGCAIVGHGPVNLEGEPLFRALVHDLDVVWVARDYTQAGIMWHEFIRPRFKGVDGVRVNEGDRTVTLEGAGTLFVISAENIASARGMGKRLAGMIVEEAAWLDLQAALRDVIMPALMDNEGWLLLISTTNAGPDGNPQKETPSYFNRICEEIQAGERSDEWAEFHFTAADNPKISAKALAALVAEYPAGSPSLEQEVYAKLLRGGVGLALEQVSDQRHIVERFPIPEHWSQFGAFDWGFDHPYAFGWFAADESGSVVLVDTVIGRQHLPDQLAARVEAAIPVKSLRYIVGGHDLNNDVKARGETGPTLKERFTARGWKLIDANISRVSGLNNLRMYVEWQATEDTPERVPRFRMMDTEGNRTVLRTLQRMQKDPKRIEDALKVDADAAGNGGDDCYDMVRYGLMSRPIAPARPRETGQEKDRAMPINWKVAKQPPRESAEQALAKTFARDAAVQRHRPVRPRW